ncbi:dynein heavy chain domain-containing protein 1 [Misgurnus anguillicaudatus]|uniref:dynein heavy chain domain-containing protein 1 n=1 Tax=Misgurnus anguillicaudatus TaxID=75329 RepID=UPI003CCFD92D
MSSSKREAHAKGFSKSAINQRKSRNRVDSLSDYSFDPVAPRTQSHEYLTSLSLPPFRQESLPFYTNSTRTLSPPQNDLSVVKLPQLVSKVGIELALRESPWNDGPRFVASAISADIPIKILKSSGVTFNVEHEKPAVPDEKTTTRKKCNLKHKPFTGTELFDILTKKKHLGVHEFFYLKATEGGPYRPYDLHVIPHNALGTDYYTFSPTTVVHVQDGCSVELWTLAGWYQESLLWGAVKDIPFFRDYLLRKTFKRWHRNVHIATVKHRTDSLPSQLLMAVPQFRDALQQLSRSIEEIKQVSWLPQDDCRTYTLIDFQTALLERKQAAQDSLNSFLHCHAEILDMAKMKSYKVHQELQMEVEHSKLYQSGQSLNLQLSNLRNLQKELSRAEQALQQLGNLSALADCMIVQNLITILREEVRSFQNNVIKREKEQQGALFQADIVFGADGQLTVFPPLHLFQEVLMGALLSLPETVLLVFDSYSLSCDSKVRLRSGSVLISDAEDFTAGTSRACTSRNTGTADKGCEVEGAGSVFSQKEGKMSHQTIVPAKMKSLRVLAQRVRGHYQPLPRRQLEWHLKTHAETQEIQNEQTNITQGAITEVYHLCEGHSWLTDVHLFTNQWGSACLEALRGCSSVKYEELIENLHFWMDKVQSMPPFFTTSNKLFTVKIANIKEDIGTLLGTIDEDVQKLLCEDFQSRSENLASELRRAVEIMKFKTNTFESFTVFSNMVKHSAKMSDDFKQRLEDLHSLQETVQRNYTHMTPDGIFLMKQITDLWDQFGLLLKPAADIVSQELPCMVNTLDSNFSSLVNKLENLFRRASSEPYLDPDQNAKEMLIQLNALCSQFHVIAEQLNNLSRASESLRGHLLDLTFVTEAQKKIEARKALWELMSVSSTQIQEWKRLKFSKFVVAKAQDKINEWLQQADILARDISSHDAVLQKTLQILQGFNQLIPILSKLRSPTLSNKHWKSISKEIGLLYDPEGKFTLAELMSKELLQKQNRINKICLEAKADADMDHIFQTLKTHWEGAVFHHSRFVVSVQQQLEDAKEKSTSYSSESPLRASKHHVRDGGTFTIVGLETLLGQTKESILSLSDILRSLHIADFKQEVECWLQLLQRLEKLLDLFERYQNKWTFLSKTIKQTSARKEPNELIDLQEMFHPLDKMFREIIRITVNDPHVLSFVHLKLTTEASQGLQEQSLYTVLMNGLRALEEISSQLFFVLESARSQFPRLYFLSDEEVMKLLSLPLPTPSSLLPLVQKCFKGVRWLDVHCESDAHHEHDLTDLSSEMMCVCGIYGDFREHVSFLCPLEPNLNPVAWLCLFEEKLHATMKQTILKCIDVQQCSALEEHEDSAALIENNKRNSSEVVHESYSLLQLISLYPLQCLLVVEEVLWCTVVQKLFQSPTAAMSAAIKSRNTAKLHYLCQQLKVHLANSNVESLASQHVIKALRAFVMLTMKHSQQTDGLVKVKADLDSSFEWHKLMKYYLSPSDYVAQCEEGSACINHSVYVDILCTQFPYGYEYIGPENWMMVTTPSTEKAYMGIILALSSYKCAFISGPHMSGKKHISLQLGYALGRQVVSMKCYPTMDSSIVSQMLLGALQTGAWLVLDSVDSMEQGTLSELGQHLADINQHLSEVQKLTQQERHVPQCDILSNLPSSSLIKKHSNSMNEAECHIAGKNILAKLSYGCITIASNGSSTEIPENLRVAIRPVSLIEPHYKMIAEVILISLGFSKADNVSRRLVSLFSLAKDSQCLPDFLSGHQTSWLVLLKNALAASGTHLDLDCQLRETGKNTISRQISNGSVDTTLDPLATIPEKVKDNYSLNFKSMSNAIINKELEEHALIKGILSVMQYTVSDPKRALQFNTIFEEIFPKAKCFTGLQQMRTDEKEQNILGNAVKDEFQQRGFHADAQMLHNVLILYQALKLSNVVLLVGQAGSGKTTLYQVLANALQKLSRAVEVESHDSEDFTDIKHRSSMPCWTSVSTEILFPHTLSHNEFFGGFCEENNTWFDGAFCKALRHIEEPLVIPPFKSKKKNIQNQSMKWIVLDGEPLGKLAWLDSLSTLCNLDNPYVRLSSGEKIEPSRGRVKILSEMTDIGDSNPSVLTQCNLVYVSGENLWKAVWESEMDVLSIKHNVDQITLNMWRHLAKNLFTDTVMFLKNKRQSSVMASVDNEENPSSWIADGLQEVMSFFRILNALLDHFGKGGGLSCPSSETETTDNAVLKPHCSVSMIPILWCLPSRNIFCVYYIWGFGGHLHPRHWSQFDLFARDVLHRSDCKVETPPDGTVFDHFFEFNEEMGDTTNFFNYTKQKSPLLFRTVSQYEKHAYLLDMLLDAHQPALLVGESGSGKTLLCKSLISQARSHVHLPAGPGLRSFDFHKAFEKVRYRETQLSNMGFLKRPNFLLFIDDLHEAEFDACAKTSMTLEMLRQSISRGEVLSTDGTHFKFFQSKAIDYLGTCSAPHVGNNIHISPRLLRLFTILALPSMTLEVLFSMHSSKLQSWLKATQPLQSIADLANSIITSTLDVYLAVREHFATSAHCLSTMYSLHDISKVFQGMYLWRPRLDAQKHLQSSQGVKIFSSTEKTIFLPAVFGPVTHELNITRLWMHECLRTFGDRLASSEACQELISVIAKVSEKNYGTRMCLVYQTSLVDISNPVDRSSAISTCNLNEQVLSTTIQLRENHMLGMEEVHSKQTEQVLERSSSLCSLGEDEDALLHKENKLKENESVKSEPATLEGKSESPTESFALFTQHVPPTTYEKVSPKMIHQFLQELALSIQNVVFSPEFCEPLKNILYDFKRNSVYQERDPEVLVDQLICALKSREDKSANSIPRWAVNHQNVYQLVHILRAFLIPGGHGALLGATRKTGRKSMVRLAATLLGYRLIELHPRNEAKLKEILKDIGSRIGVGGRHLAVLVHEDTSQAVKDELLLMMANGTVPGLYSDQDLKKLILKMKMQMKKTHCQLTDDQLVEMYFKTIQSNMHVFQLYPLLLDDKAKQPEKFSVMERHITKALSLCCCVDVYQPWTSKALAESALYHLKDSDQAETNSTVAKDNLVASISQAMAEIHLSATKYAVTQLNFQPFSPRSFKELMVQFDSLLRHLSEHNSILDNRLAKVLASVKGMTDTTIRHSEEVLSLRARCEEKQKCLKQLQVSLDTSHKIWDQTRLQNLLEEKRLSELENRSHQVQQQVQDTFKQVSPLFQAAVEALQALSQSDLDEVRHYRIPPDGVVAVIDVICMLLNHPCGWENSKQLLMQPNFLEKLEFFDCSTLSDEMIKTLGQIMQAPSFQPSFVRDVSRACESLCRWLGAIYQYACVQQRMAPMKAQKCHLDELMTETRARLSVARMQKVSAGENLQELEKQQEVNRQDMELLKLQLSTAEEDERKSSAALRPVERYIEDWYLAEKEAKLYRYNTPGDALILAATITYLGPFRPDVRQELLQKWHKLCLTGVTDVNPEGSNTHLHSDSMPIPVSKTFQMALNRVLGLDLCLIRGDCADFVRSVVLWGHRAHWVQRWPLLADVHQHEELNSQTLFPAGGSEKNHEDKFGIIVSADDPELLDKLNHGADEGLSVLVTHIERAAANIKILQPFLQTPASVFSGQSHSVKAVHPDFRLFMSTCLPVPAVINEIHPSFLDEVQIISLSLSTTEVQDLILAELMKSEWCKQWTLHCQLQTEKQTLQDELSQNKVSLMEYVMHSSTPLLQDPEFLPLVYTCQSVSHELEIKIKELSQKIDRHKSLMAEFYRVAKLATDLYNALQDVAQLSTSYLFTLRHYLRTLRSALSKGSSDVSVHERMEGTVIVQITNRIVSHFFSQYKPCLFQSHAALLRLLVSVALIVHNEGCSEIERVAFLRELSHWKSSECILSLSTQSVPELPSWIPAQTKADIYLLETIAPFRGLVSSLSSSSKLWQEYFRFPSSTVIGPVPCPSHSHLSTMQRAILWKTLCPHWLAAVGEDLTACAQGYLLNPLVAEGPPMGSPEELSQLLSKNIGQPVVVQLPNKSQDAYMSIHPIHLIQQAAQYQADKKGVKVTVISFGTGCHRNAVLSALDSAVQNGHWLVLNNCHLLDCWDVRVVDKLTQLVSCQGHMRDLELDGPLLKSEGTLVHPHFRLWLITKGDKPQSVPAAVRICALHLVCDSSWGLKDELWSSVKQTLFALDSFSSSAHTETTARSHLQCAVLHSVLLQRQAFKHLGQGQLYLWTHEDLFALIDAHDRITKHCSDPSGALEYIAGHLVYGGHVSDHADLAAVQSVVAVCLRQPSASWGRGPHNLSDVFNFRGSFDAESLLKGLSHRIKCIKDSTDPIILGFSPGMAGELIKLRSQTLNIQLNQSQSIYGDIRGDISLKMQPQELTEYKQGLERLRTLQDKLKKRKTYTGLEIGSSYLSPLYHFLLAELERLDKLVSLILLDHFRLAKYNIKNSTPAYLTSAALSRLETQADLLGLYLWEESSSILPHAYQLAAFLNPQGFLVALIRDVAHTLQKDISVFSLHFKVLKDTASPSPPSQNGACLFGLELQGALWEPGTGCLKEALSPKPSYFPPLWVSVREKKDDFSQDNSSLPFYYCPLYVDKQTADGDQCLSADNIVAYVPLATRLDPVLCAMRRVRLTSTLLQLSV